MRDWRTEPRSCAYGGFAVLTQAETDAWDEHEAYLIAQGQHDRSAFFDQQANNSFMEHKAHEMNVAICNAIANQAPWED